MVNQLTSNAEALRLFFTEDIYLVNNGIQTASALPVKEEVKLEISTATKTETTSMKELEVSLPVVEEPIIGIKRTFDFKFLGKNQKNILILVNDKEQEVSTEQGRELLRKLVNAIALTAKDFALVNYANYVNATYQDFNNFFSCKLILAFGVSPKQLELADQQLHQLTQHQQTKIIFTTNLHDLDSDQVSKKILWSSLQQLK